ncbi:MAG TPA: hypothetical protein VKI18_01270 [Albitalea sp.]|nr:hypothetical protein [Albitalea sp.]
MSAVTAAAALLAGALLAVHHPLWPNAALLLFAAWTVGIVWRPSIWLCVVPASLPLLNFSPWTGWLTFDELDLLLLGVIAAGHARLALRPAAPADGGAGLPRFVCVSVLVFSVASVIALGRGFADAGGFSFGWFQSYVEPMNSLRVFKPLLWMLLIAAPMHERIVDSREQAMRSLGAGMSVGLTLVGLAVVWERLAHPGLLNFSLPYRTVGAFWEMHVGGAAIDAYLALAAPFAAWAVWSARTPARWSAAALVALLTGYVCLTTFSRGVYLAVAAPLVLLGIQLAARWPADAATASFARRAVVAAASSAAATGLVVVAYALAGYRGVIVVVLAAAALLALAARRWPAGFAWRSTAGRALMAALVIEALAVAWTGSFLIERMSQSDRDFGSRLAHWKSGLGLLYDPADRAFGIGLGRLPAHYARFVRGGEFSGTVQWRDDGAGKPSVTLAGPVSRRKLAGQYSLMQQVPLLHGRDRYRVELDYRVWTPTPIFVGVCELHLLYERQCQGAWANLVPSSSSWQHLSLTLHGPELDAGPWFARRLGFLAVSVLEANRAVEIGRLALTTTGDRPLLRNGDFSDRLAHWFPSAQGYFVPWHIDNLYLELLIERGPAGLLAFVVLVGWTLRRLMSAPGRDAMLAPFLAASLCGILLVGLVSSVLDAARPQFLMWFLLGFALLLCATTSSAAAPSTSLRCR